MAQENEKEVENQEKEEEGSRVTEHEEGSEEKAEEQQQQMRLPPVNFENFILGLYNTALIHLGFRDPESGELIQNLPLSRHTIDTLGMIQERTKGNLTAPENNLLENLLYELRMSYLRAAKRTQEEPKKEEEETEQEPAEPQRSSEAQEPPDAQDESKREPETEGKVRESQEESEAQNQG